MIFDALQKQGAFYDNPNSQTLMNSIMRRSSGLAWVLVPFAILAVIEFFTTGSGSGFARMFWTAVFIACLLGTLR